MRVGAITCGKHTRDVRTRAIAFHLDIPLGIQVQIIGKQLGVRLVTDSQEESVNCYMPLLLIRQTFLEDQIRSLHLRFTGQSQRVVLEQDLNLRVVEHTLLHDFRRTQIGLANNHIHLLAQVSQIGRLFARCITAAYHGYSLAAIEEPVTRGASTHTTTAVLFLAGNTQPLGGSTGSNNHRVSLIERTVVRPHFLGRAGEIHFLDNSRYELRTETFCLATDIIHHLERFNAIRITGEVLHLGGDSQLSA